MEKTYDPNMFSAFENTGQDSKGRRFRWRYSSNRFDGYKLARGFWNHDPGQGSLWGILEDGSRVLLERFPK